MLKIAICDEDKNFVEYLSDLLNEIIERNKLDLGIVFNHNGIEELGNFLINNSADIFLIDVIYAKKPAGIDIAKRIRKENINSFVVFITTHNYLVFDSFKVRAFDFISKPVRNDTIESIVFDIIDEYNKRAVLKKDTKQILNVKNGVYICQVPCDEIFLIERVKRKIAIYTATNTITCYESLDSIQTKMKSNRFLIRCHRSYIINKDKVEKIDLKNNKIIFNNGIECLIGKTYKKAISILFSN